MFDPQSGEQGAGRFLITGCQRSGTTLMAMALEAHPLIEMVEENDARFHVPGMITRELDLDAAHRQVARQGRRLIGYKVPRDSHRIDEVVATFPRVQVVWVERDIRQTVASMLTLKTDAGSWGEIYAPFEIRKYISKTKDSRARHLYVFARDLEDQAARSVAFGSLCWMVKREQRYRATRLLGSRVLHVDYDELVRNPGDVLRGVLDFLNLPWSPLVLCHPASVADVARPGGSDPRRPIDARSRHKWKSRLSQKDLDIIERVQRSLEGSRRKISDRRNASQGESEVLSENTLRFVIIVGCQRSGTTLMGQIIGAHPKVRLVDEKDRVYEWMGSIFDSDNDRERQDKINELSDCARSKYRRIDGRSRSSAGILVLQAPNLTWSYKQISTCLPDVRVVYMLRDVRAVVASMLALSRIPFVANQIRFFRQTGFIEKDFPEEWKRLMDGRVNKAVKMALVAKIKMSLADRFEARGIPLIRVKYEDLILEPRKTVEKVIRHIGIPFDGTCLEHEQVYVGLGPGGTDRVRPIDKASLTRWRRELQPEIEESIWQAVGGFYERLGYQRTD